MTDDIMLMGKNPNFLGSWDLYDAPGKAITVTIRSIESETVTNAVKTDMVTVCHFVEPVKPMILNLTNRKTLTKLYETKSSSHLVGKRITIGFEKVKAFGSIHDALRIRAVIPEGGREEETSVRCVDCGELIRPAYGRTVAQLAQYTRGKFGRALCTDCARAAAERAQAEASAASVATATAVGGEETLGGEGADTGTFAPTGANDTGDIEGTVALPEEAPILCQDCGNPITAAYGRTPAQLAAHTRSKFGRALCCDCAMTASAMGKQQEEEDITNQEEKDITNQEEEDAAGVAEIQRGESET